MNNVTRMEWGAVDYNNRIICTVQDGIISEMNNYGQTQAIGHTNDRFEELVKVANEYKDLCIKHGLIEVEKTPEQQQMEMMQQMMSVINGLKTEVEVLKNGSSENSNTGGKSTGGRPRKSTTSNKSSAEADE